MQRSSRWWCKADGRSAELLAVGIAGWFEGAFPVMTALGPVMVLQCWWWTRRRRAERTTRDYLLAEPLPTPAAA